MIREPFRCAAWLALCAMASAAACKKPGDEDLGLGRPSEPVVALDKLDDPAQLLGALAQRGATLDAQLGPRGFDLKHTLELGEGTSGDLVEEAIRLDTDGKGAFHLVKELGHPRALAPAPVREGSTGPKEMVDPLAQGMEAVALPGQLYLRPRYGRFVERRPEPGELDRLRALGERILHDDLEVLVPFLKIEQRGTGSIMGRRTRSLVLSARGSRAAMEGDDDPRHAWRQALTVTELRGQLELDAETGLLLKASLEARYGIPQPKGAPLAAHLVVTQEPRPPQPIAAPPDFDPTPHRPRPTAERNQLLEGLAPAAGTQASGARP